MILVASFAKLWHFRYAAAIVFLRCAFWCSCLGTKSNVALQHVADSLQMFAVLSCLWSMTQIYQALDQSFLAPVFSMNTGMSEQVYTLA